MINEIHIDRHLHDEDDCHKIIHIYVNASTVHGGLAEKDFCFTSLLADELKSIHVSMTLNETGPPVIAQTPTITLAATAL